MEYGTIDAGCTGATVREVQEYLNFLSKRDPSIPAVNPDGIPGPQTEASLRAFQKEYGIDPDAEGADLKTWNCLRAAYRKAAEACAPGIAVLPLQNTAVLNDLSSCPELVAMVQLMLDILRAMDDTIPQQTADGVPCRAFTDAIRCIQRLWGLPQTGTLDTAAFNAIAASFNHYVGQLQAEAPVQ